MTPREQAVAARDASRVLQALTSTERANLLRRMATALLDNQAVILEANANDLDAGEALSEALKARLGLTEKKLQTLAAGLTALADG